MARKPGGKNNSFKHGSFAENFGILPDENGDEFAQLHQGLVEEWKPAGALEEDTILDIAQCIWLKRRVERFYRREAMGGQLQDADEIRFVTFLMDLLDNSETLEEATVVTGHLPELYRERIAETVPRSKFKDDKSWIQSLGDRIASFAVAHAKFAAATQSMAYKASKTTYLRELTSKKNRSGREA